MVTQGHFSRVQFLLTQVYVHHEREREVPPVLRTTSAFAEGLIHASLLLDLSPHKQ